MRCEGNFSAEVFESVVELAPMFARRCHSVSAEEQFDKAALPR